MPMHFNGYVFYRLPPCTPAKPINIPATKGASPPGSRSSAINVSKCSICPNLIKKRDNLSINTFSYSLFHTFILVM